MILGELQGKLGGIPGVKTFATAPPAIPIGAGEMPVEFVIKSPGDYTKVAEVLDKIEAEAKKSGLFIFTNTDLRFETPQAELIIDKDKANQLGIRMVGALCHGTGKRSRSLAKMSQSALRAGPTIGVSTQPHSCT